MGIPQGTIEIDHPKIASITFATEVGDRADQMVEIFVELRDGRHFSFTVYTPRALEHLMRENGWPSLVDLDVMIVREIGLGPILHALDQMLALGIERFGLEMASEEG